MTLVSKPINKKRVMVFGTFDLLHEGHLDFLKQAGGICGGLGVAVPSDRMVWILKNKKPSWDEKRRLAAVASIDGVAKAVLGDDEIGTYSIIKQHKPYAICLGYDQDALKKDLEEKIQRGILPKISLITLKAHYPEKFKTSILLSNSHE